MRLGKIKLIKKEEMEVAYYTASDCAHKYVTEICVL